MKHYIIVKSAFLTEFEEIVNKNIQLGYKPFGILNVIVVNINELRYIQAMVK